MRCLKFKAPIQIRKKNNINIVLIIAPVLQHTLKQNNHKEYQTKPTSVLV